MSKKIIAALLIFTVLFTCVFAACNTDEEEEDTRVYIADDEYDFVTDENGEKIYNEYGEFLVYATDENGKAVTNENGEKETLAQPFEAFEKDGTYEDYGYKFTLPEGWEATDKKGRFQNPDKGQSVTVTILNKSYKEYRETTLDQYEDISENEEYKDVISVSWEDDVVLNDECSGTYRFTLSSEAGANVMYVFINNGNLYKILFETTDAKNAIADSEAICKAVSYKPYTYESDFIVENEALETEPSTEEETTAKAE